ncbi:YciI family protein [Catellatospora tritici]|uniref:YciI family protein n=1 Tax=Catellatospora tritici TaxID=2851566 RepID=UPI001C2D4623|nr:YciI family protein [Catellatospora tritici]MBV1854472.1 hypothetical protein [Catellatospora tritici]
MKYVMLICNDPDLEQTLTPEQLREEYDRIVAVMDGWQERGVLASGGAELQHPKTARTLRGDGVGGTVVTDGPYLELKEVVGGFIMLETDTIEQAVEVAAEWPGLRHGASVEVRPIVAH